MASAPCASEELSCSRSHRGGRAGTERLGTELCSGCVCWGTKGLGAATRRLWCLSSPPSNVAEFWELIFSQPLAFPSQHFQTLFAIALQEAGRLLLREHGVGGAGQRPGKLGSAAGAGWAAQPKALCDIQGQVPKDTAPLQREGTQGAVGSSLSSTPKPRTEQGHALVLLPCTSAGTIKWLVLAAPNTEMSRPHPVDTGMT